MAGYLLLLFYNPGHITQKWVPIILMGRGRLKDGLWKFSDEVEKGGGDEENHYVGNCFSDNACIYWRMLAMVVGSTWREAPWQHSRSASCLWLSWLSGWLYGRDGFHARRNKVLPLILMMMHWLLRLTFGFVYYCPHRELGEKPSPSGEDFSMFAVWRTTGNQATPFTT